MNGCEKLDVVPTRFGHLICLQDLHLVGDEKLYMRYEILEEMLLGFNKLSKLEKLAIPPI